MSHPVEIRYNELLLAAGATISNHRGAATTYSDYATLRCGTRTIELRGSDHHNFANPRTAKTARAAGTLRYTAAGFERALALWLGWSENDLRVRDGFLLRTLKLSTKRDLKILAAKPREIA